MKFKLKLPKRSSSGAQTPTQGPRSKGTQTDASTRGASNSNAPPPVAVVFTKDIRFLGVGVDSDQARYLILQVGDQVLIVRVGNLSVNAAAEYARLERAGVPLVTSGAQTEFLKLAQQHAGKTPTYHVVTTNGWHGSTFYFPDEAIPRPEARVEFYPDQELAAIYSRFVCAGTRDGTTQLLSLFRGNSRLITFTALSLVGPLVGIMPLEVPDLQVVGDPGSGKTAILVVASATWGWDDKGFGFGTSWSTTLNQLEVTLQGYHQALACLNETRLVPGDKRSRAQTILDAIMVAAEGTGKARYKEAKSRSFFRRLLAPRMTRSSPCCAPSVSRLTPRTSTASWTSTSPPAVAASTRISMAEKTWKPSSSISRNSRGNHGLWAAPTSAAWPRRYATTSKNSSPSSRRGGASTSGSRSASLRRAQPGARSRQVRHDLRRRLPRDCFRLLPFTGAELRDAILTCEGDHVALVAREMGHDLNSASSPHLPPLALTSPYEVLRHYVFGPKRESFVDLRKPGALPPQGHAHANCPGYLGRHRGQDEVWLRDALIEQLVGGRSAARAVKADLETKGLIVIEGHGANKKYVVKRKIPGVGNVRVVALRLKQAPVAVPRKRPFSR